MQAALAGWLRGWHAPTRAIDRFVGRFLTEPKPAVWFDSPSRKPGAQAFASAARRRGLRADRRTRLAYRGRDFFINGEWRAMSASAAPLLRRLADERRLPPGTLTATPVDPALLAALQGWFDAGWICYG